MSRLVFRALLVMFAALSFSGPTAPSGPPSTPAYAQAARPSEDGAPCLPPALSTRAGAVTPADEPRSYVPGVVIVQLRPGFETAQAAAVAETVGGTVHCRFADWDIYLVQVAPGSEADALAQLQDHPWVASAQVDRVVRVHGIPNDVRFMQQWALGKINAPAAWDISTGSSEVIIAIVDSGIDLTHPDLQSKIVLPFNVANNSANAMDDNGHGTHVAGIAAAASDNGTGVTGVAWGARIMPVKVVNDKGESTETLIANGMKYAVDKGAQIINLSLGGPDPDIILQEAVNYAYSKGALVIASAGNCYSEGTECDGKINPPIYPAAYPHVLAVGGTDAQDGHASYSETGDYVDLVAPGGDPPGSTNPAQGILGTALRTKEPSGYGVQSGTSQAAPHVSGVAALVWSVNPTLTNDQVAQVLTSTAADLGPPGQDPTFGAGRVNALAALQAARALTGAPALVSPAEGSALPGMGATLRWTNPPNTTQYQIQVIPANNDGPGLNLIIGDPDMVAAASYTVPPPVLGQGNYIMLPGMSYTWRVRATAKATFAPEDDPSWGPWSLPRTYRTPAPSSAGLRPTHPAAGATVPSSAPQTLRWEHADPSLFYWEVQVSGDTRFDADPTTATSFVWWNLVHGGSTSPLNSWTTPPLAAQTTYYWRVRPRVQGDGVPVDWGPVWSFTTPPAP
ncbi:MAG: peptidase S8 [Chloroflexi bacterium]|nr:peptidase S8 [Chloroflexota bacterium]